jgi:hypothetical protein
MVGTAPFSDTFLWAHMCSWAFTPSPAFFEALEHALLPKKQPSGRTKHQQQQQQGLEPIHVPPIIYFYSICKLSAAPKAAPVEFHQALASGSLPRAETAAVAASWCTGNIPAENAVAHHPSLALIEHLATILSQDLSVVPAGELVYWVEALLHLSSRMSPNGSPGVTWVPKQQWVQQFLGALGPQLQQMTVEELAEVGHFLIDFLPEGKVGSNLVTTGDWWELYCMAADEVTDVAQDHGSLLGVLRGLGVLSSREKYVPDQLVQKICTKFGKLQLLPG